MKHKLKILFFCLSCLCITSAVSGQTPQQTFDKANKLYQKHAYDSAIQLYSNLIKSGYQNPELYYNAGIANYKAGHSGYAVYYFEKALQKSPGNNTIEHNLQLAKQQATNKIDQIPTLFFIRWWRHLLNFNQANGWITGSIIFFWIFLFFLGWIILKPPAPRWTKWIMIFAAILFCIYMAGAIGSWYRATHHLYAIVVQPNETLKSAPDINSTSIMEAHEGLKVKITDSVDGWKKVQLTDGKEGWIQSRGMLGL